MHTAGALVEDKTTAVNKTVGLLISRISEVECRLRLMHSRQTEEKSRNSILHQDLSKVLCETQFLHKARNVGVKNLKCSSEALKHDKNELELHRKASIARKSEFDIIFKHKKDFLSSQKNKRSSMKFECERINQTSVDIQQNISFVDGTADFVHLGEKIRATENTLSKLKDEVLHLSSESSKSSFHFFGTLLYVDEHRNISAECDGFQVLEMREGREHNLFLKGKCFPLTDRDSTPNPDRERAEQWNAQCKQQLSGELNLLAKLSAVLTHGHCFDCPRGSSF